jgi:hypothetical protein
MRRVLIVSPRFCPVNAPDLHRVRLALPHLPRLGWDPVVLALSPDTVEGAVLEPLLERSCPADLRVIRVRGLPPCVTRRFGFGGLWLRAGHALRRAGDALLEAESFDLVFFSTTQFECFTLGPRWLARYRVPYVLDYQDPWLTHHYARTGRPPPGGPLRFAFSQWRARRCEPSIVSAAAGLVSVSPDYLAALSARVPCLAGRPSLVLPFGASPADLALALAHPPAAPLVPRGDGLVHLVHTGRGGADLEPALDLLFSALATLRRRDPVTAARLRLHFIGTSYAPAPLGRESILPIARRHGLGDLVNETCGRVPYLEALYYLARADAQLALGSEDPSYSASKLAPCLLAGRPLLALFHHASPAHPLLARHAPSALRIAFDPARPPSPETLDELVSSLDKLSRPAAAPAISLPPELHAAETTRELAGLFDRALSAA